MIAPFASQSKRRLTAYRDWALANPVDFQLIYGSPIPGYEAPRDVTLPAATRVLASIIQALAEAYAARVLRPPAAFLHLPLTVESHLRSFAEAYGCPVPPEVFAVGIHAWNLIHGMVWLELFGHTPPIIGDSAAFYRHQLLTLCRDLNLTVTTP